mgnify:FL=1|tara:strand:+ start:359 stop:787 length:429 start_codon:yes stop_codon:yes gene_type:complete
MNFDKAINRLQWKFSKGINSKTNTTDIEAINFVFGWIENQKNINVLNQTLFAKLYILKLNEELIKFDATIFDPLIEKNISRILDLPMHTFYESFHSNLHHNHLKKLDLKKGVSDEDVKERFTLEIVTDKLNHKITEAINRFS